MASVKELFSHGKNYLIANVATRALNFISVPILTRLLTPEDYGINGVFLGTVMILSSIYNLNIDKSISRYYYDQKNEKDFKKYVGTCYFLMFFLFLLSSVILIFFQGFFSNLLGVNPTLLLCAIPIVFINIIISSFQQIYQPLKQSALVAKFSTIQIYLIFLISVPIVYLLPSERYYGLVWGQVIGGAIIVVCLIKYVKPFIKLHFDRKYMKYMLFYSIPLIPEALSGIIIEQFGKLYIGGSMGMDSAGYYTFVASISSLVLIIVSVSNQAWVPYYFEYMNSKDYLSLDKDLKRILILTFISALGVSCFGKELALLLAKSNYAKFLYLLPLLCIGYAFFQLFYVYYRNISYVRKTLYMSLIVVVSGIINVLCNSMLVQRFQELGVAISFMLSYLTMVILAWLINKLIVKIHSTPIRYYLFPLLVFIISEVVLFIGFDYGNYALNLILRLFLFVCATFLMLGQERQTIISYCKQFIRK